MKLQQLISDTDLSMTVPQVKAFFLGAMSAEKPMPFNLALEELLSSTTDAKKLLEAELKTLWNELLANKESELDDLFNFNGDLVPYLDFARDQLDYFLTSMSLAGTHADACSDEDVAELIDELEDTVMDMDEYLSEAKPSKEEGEEMKEFLLEAWKDFLDTKQF